MAQYRRKFSVIEAITFDELVEHGRQSGAPLYRNMPWSFSYKGNPITHESDDCYLIPAGNDLARFGRTDMLVTGANGSLVVTDRDAFEAIYERAE